MRSGNTAFLRLKGLRFAIGLLLLLSGCNLSFGDSPPLTATPDDLPPLRVTVAWAAEGDLFVWREDAPTPEQIASGGVVAPYLSPDGAHIAFTRGADGDTTTLWVIGSDGTDAREIVPRGSFPARGQGRPEIAQVAWLDDATLYFNTRQQTVSGEVADENLYRVALDDIPQMILPPGAGGSFSISPNGQWIAVASAGNFGLQPGRISILDPLGARVREVLTYPALTLPQEPPATPALEWNADSSLVRLALINRDTGRVVLWRIPVVANAPVPAATAVSTATPVPPTETPIAAATEAVTATEEAAITVIAEATATETAAEAGSSATLIPTAIPTATADEQAQIFGTVGALPNGLPRWGRSSMIYRQVSDVGVALIVADENSESPEIYANGRVEDAWWLPDGEHFAIIMNGVLLRGKRGTPAQLLLSTVPDAVQFARTGGFVYRAAGELRYGTLNGEGELESQLIASVPDGTLFDVVAAP